MRIVPFLCAVGALTIAGCVGASPRAARPAEKASPSPSAHAAAPSRRDRLAASCLTVEREEYLPPIPAEHRERLAGLERDCRDVHPELPPTRFASTTDIPAAECHYGVGRIYFELGHHVEAARWFRRVIDEDDDVALGAFAAEMYLGSLEALARGASPERSACRALAREDAARFVERYCVQPETEDACPVFERAATASEGRDR